MPFGLGAGSDVGARLLGQKISDALGQSVVVDNKPGANGVDGRGRGKLQYFACPAGPLSAFGHSRQRNTPWRVTLNAPALHRLIDMGLRIAPALNTTALVVISRACLGAMHAASSHMTIAK